MDGRRYNCTILQISHEVLSQTLNRGLLDILILRASLQDLRRKVHLLNRNHLLPIPPANIAPPRRLSTHEICARLALLDLLLQEKIQVVQGTGFNWPAPDHFRILTLPHADDLDAAVARIGRFLSSYRQ